MSDNVISGPWDGFFPEGHPELDEIEPDDVLRGALEQLDEVIVLGVDKDGDLDIRSNLSPAEAALLMQRAIIWLAQQQFKVKA